MENQETPNRSTHPERIFLHALASPLTAIQFALSHAREDLGALGALDPALSQRIDLALRSAERMTEMIAARRQAIIDQENQAEKG